MNAKERAATQVLVLDAIIRTASDAAVIGIGYATEKPVGGAYLGETRNLAKRFAEPYPYLSDPSPVLMANREVSTGGYGGFTSGMEAARKAAVEFATTQDSRTWAAEVLVEISKNTFLKGREQGLVDEENIKRSVMAVWAWITERESSYREFIESKLYWRFRTLVRDDYSADELLRGLEAPMNEASFKLGIPAYQDFYERSVARVAAELNR